MEGPALIADALERVNRILHRALDGVSAEMLCTLPSPDTNSMAWLAWHLTRVHDDHMADLAGQQELWTSAGWHDRFHLPPDESNTGTGHTPEQVAALKVDSSDVLLGYNDATLERSKAFLATLTPDDLDRVLDEPQWDPRPTVGVRLVSIVSDNTQHAGQIAYLRGLLQGYGWQRI